MPEIFHGDRNKRTANYRQPNYTYLRDVETPSVLSEIFSSSEASLSQ